MGRPHARERLHRVRADRGPPPSLLVLTAARPARTIRPRRSTVADNGIVRAADNGFDMIFLFMARNTGILDGEFDMVRHRYNLNGGDDAQRCHHDWCRRIGVIRYT